MPATKDRAVRKGGSLVMTEQQELWALDQTKDSGSTGFDLYHRPIEAVQWIVRPLLHVGATVLAAKPKTGKSFLALQIAGEVALNRKILGALDSEVSGKALYFALEDPQARITRRLHDLFPDLSHDESAALRGIVFRHQLAPLSSDGMKELETHISEGGFRFVVLDTYAAASSERRTGNADLFQADYAGAAKLRNLAQQHQVALLVIHHTRKMVGSEPLDEVSGSTGLTAGFDSVAVLKRSSAGAFVLHLNSREAESEDFALQRTPNGGFILNTLGPQASLSDERKRILDLVRQQGSIMPREAAEMLGKNHATVRGLMTRTAADGYLVRDSKGRYTLPTSEMPSQMLSPEGASTP